MWFLRYHVRKVLKLWMNPPEEERIRVWYNRLKWFYIFLGWNAIFMTAFMIKKRHDRRKELGIIDDITWGHKKARAFGLEEATVYSISLTEGVRKYFYNKDTYFAAQQERLKQSMKEKQEQNPDYKIDPKELAKLANVKDFDKLF